VEFRSYRIVDQAVSEEPVEVVDGPPPTESFLFAHTPADVVYDCRER